MLKDKTILITGATGGIGYEISKLFAKSGAKLILLGRNENLLASLVGECNDGVFEHEYYVVDLTSKMEISTLFSSLSSRKFEIDCLVNCAGVMFDSGILTSSDEHVSKMFNLNVFATVDMCKYVVKNMAKRRKGTIINFGSITGDRGSKGQSIYSATKAAVVGLSKSLSKELAPLNIRVNVISPGFIQTNMTMNYNLEELKFGLGRPGEAIDVASLALFLASDSSSYITGQVIGIDGSMLI
jgi:3-oxoacyl-[acyl-carrier protein] reductase